MPDCIRIGLLQESPKAFIESQVRKRLIKKRNKVCDGVNFQCNSSQQELSTQITTNERHPFFFLNDYLVDNPEWTGKDSQLVNLYIIQYL